MRRQRARAIAPAMAANSRPPRHCKAFNPFCWALGFICKPAAITRAFLAIPAASTPVPLPTQSSARAPKSAWAIAAAEVVFPMPISPVTKRSQSSDTAFQPVCNARRNSSSSIAGPCVKSRVGRSNSKPCTCNFAPKQAES